jgi:hypothetical protein
MEGTRSKRTHVVISRCWRLIYGTETDPPTGSTQASDEYECDDVMDHIIATMPEEDIPPVPTPRAVPTHRPVHPPTDTGRSLVHRTPSIKSTLSLSSQPYPSASAPPFARPIQSRANRQSLTLNAIRKAIDPTLIQSTANPKTLTLDAIRKAIDPTLIQSTANPKTLTLDAVWKSIEQTGSSSGPVRSVSTSQPTPSSGAAISKIWSDFATKVDAAQYNLETKEKKEAARVAHQMARALNGICEVCLIDKKGRFQKEEHKKSFLACGRLDSGAQYAFMKDLKAKIQVSTPKWEYCFACLLPAKDAFRTVLHSSLFVKPRTCEFPNLVYDLLWLILQDAKWYSLGQAQFQALGGIQRTSHKQFIEWAAKTENEREGFCNAVKLALWFWTSQLEGGRALDLV